MNTCYLRKVFLFIVCGDILFAIFHSLFEYALAAVSKCLPLIRYLKRT